MAIDQVTASLILGGLSGLSGAINSGNQANMNSQQLAENRRQFDRQMGQQQGQQALQATQMDPLSQQRSRQKAALVAQLLKGYQPTQLQGNRFVGGMTPNPELIQSIMSYFSPEANQAAEQQFAMNATAASGGKYAMPNLAALGYGAPQGAGGVNTTTPMPTATPVAVPRDPYSDPRTDARRRLGGMEV